MKTQLARVMSVLEQEDAEKLWSLSKAKAALDERRANIERKIRDKTGGYSPRLDFGPGGDSGRSSFVPPPAGGIEFQGDAGWGTAKQDGPLVRIRGERGWIDVPRSKPTAV